MNNPFIPCSSCFGNGMLVNIQNGMPMICSTCFGKGVIMNPMYAQMMQNNMAMPQAFPQMGYPQMGGMPNPQPMNMPQYNTGNTGGGYDPEAMKEYIKKQKEQAKAKEKSETTKMITTIGVEVAKALGSGIWDSMTNNNNNDNGFNGYYGYY